MTLLTRLHEISKVRHRKFKVGGRFKEPFDILLFDVGRSYIPIPEFLRRYAQRDEGVLELCGSYDTFEDYAEHLLKEKLWSSKYNWDFKVVGDLDGIAKKMKECSNAAAQFNVQTKFVFYNQGHTYGFLVVTVNLGEECKKWGEAKGRAFLNDFVMKADELTRFSGLKRVMLDQYYLPNYHILN